jgi:hypothetical protein
MLGEGEKKEVIDNKELWGRGGMGCGTYAGLGIRGRECQSLFVCGVSIIAEGLVHSFILGENSGCWVCNHESHTDTVERL